MSGSIGRATAIPLALIALSVADLAARSEEVAMPAAGPAAPIACGAQAARYGDAKGFDLLVTRVGEVRVENPLRPLTPEVNHVLQVVIAGKVATAYGPDFAALRRGGAPSAVEGMLGGAIGWKGALPPLPDPIAIVAEDGAVLAQLSFRACEDAPAIKLAPVAKKKPPGAGASKGGAPRPAAAKAPPGFSMPQGAIAD